MSTTIHLMQGLPGSGKSTYVGETFVNDEIVASRDTISKMFGVVGKGILDADGEAKVTEVQTAIIRDAISRGVDVVVDDTNLNNVNARRFYKFGVNVQPHVMDTPVEECLLRNSLRPDRVPDEVILRMWSQRDKWPILEPQVFTPYVPNRDNHKVYVFDIDGTLATAAGRRSPYDYSKVHQDDVIREIADIVLALWSAGTASVFLSGRSEGSREMTEGWLRANVIDVPPVLFMRAEGDFRDDSIVKSELFDTHVAPKYCAAGVFDDRSRVVNMWRTKGLRTFHVDYGQF